MHVYVRAYTPVCLCVSVCVSHEASHPLPERQVVVGRGRSYPFYFLRNQTLKPLLTQPSSSNMFSFTQIPPTPTLPEFPAENVLGKVVGLLSKRVGATKQHCQKITTETGTVK